MYDQYVLDPRRLQALHAVTTTGSVKEAASQLGYSSSAISQQITALERETGSVLLEPAGRTPVSSWLSTPNGSSNSSPRPSPS